MKCLLFSGPQENWEIAIRRNTWGVEEGNQPAKQHWAKIRAGDVVFFYATKPIMGLIGFGILRGPTESTVKLWSDGEYKCRAPFEICYEVIDGNHSPISISDLDPMVRASMNNLKPNQVEEIWKRIKRDWNVKKPSIYRRLTVNLRKSKKYVFIKDALFYAAGIITGFAVENGLNALFNWWA